ncbi:MAG: FAD-binding oxidoreductase [Pseudomonadota bacterium]
MAENIIVGGGVYGTAVAWELATRGAEVLLLEAKHVASGASGGPGRRGVRANYRDHRELPLMVRSRALWPSLHERLNVSPLFEQTGHLMLLESVTDLAAADARVSMQHLCDVPTQRLSREALLDLEPDIAPAIQGAVHCPGDGVADHGATTRAYAAAAKAAGAMIRESVSATRLVTRDDRVVAVETGTGDTIPVDGNLLLLANSGVRKLVQPWLDLPTWNLPFQALLSAPLANNPVHHLIGHASRTLSLKREQDGRLMISGGRTGRWDAATQTGTTVTENVAANVADAVAVYPSLADLKVETADAGHLEADSIDGIPVIDRLPGLANVILATGWSGHGWAIAPATAQLIAAWALDGDKPTLLAPFAFSRFAQVRT